MFLPGPDMVGCCMYNKLFAAVLSVVLPGARPALRGLFLSLLMVSYVCAEDEINLSDDMALHGYDPVSYIAGSPVPGGQAIFAMHDGVRYLFSSVDNHVQFALQPERYIPKYGGYCAYGVRMGKKLDVDPLAYEVKDESLYLLLNRATHALWKRDMVENIQIANDTWPKIKALPSQSLQ